jgi:membrane-associated protein
VSGAAATLLAWLVVYSYPVVGVTVLVAALGAPLPTTVVVLAAAGIAADGDPNPIVLAAIVFVAAVSGDLLSFGMARWGGGIVLDRLGPRVGLTAERIAPLERRFERWGGLLVVATRCLLTGLALPTNLIAGVGGYPVYRFLGCAILGEGVWTIGLMSLGWWYGSNWVELLGYIQDASTVLTIAAVVAVLGYVLVRLLRPKAVQAGVGAS